MRLWFVRAEDENVFFAVKMFLLILICWLDLFSPCLTSVYFILMKIEILRDILGYFEVTKS